MNVEELFRQVGVDRDRYDDLHITRMLHAFVAVSNGEVVEVTEPLLEYCPLVSVLYRQWDELKDRAARKKLIAEMTGEKIAQFGHFTERRELERGRIAVPYGASEMMMFAMRRGAVDCAVTVCDGAGTVIADRPELVQGIGARMNGLFYTSRIPATIKRLEGHGCHVVFPDTAAIDQAAGTRSAAELGYRNIAVTVNGYLGGGLAELADVEREHGVCVTCIVVCTTGAPRERVEEIRDHADMVWSCASASVREVVGRASAIQVSTAIPVFAVTEKGVKFLASYCSEPDVFEQLDLTKQYLIAGNCDGTPVRMGGMNTFITESELPVRSRREPRPLTE